MALVVALAQRKGGVGKSTLAANLATAFAVRGRRVALLDTDPQKTLRHWHEQRGRAGARAAPLEFDDPSGWRVPAAVDRLRRSHEVVVLDTPPHAETDARVAIRAADLVLVPLQPSAADLWATDATLQLAAAERRLAYLVLNRVPPQGKLRAEIAAELKRRKLPVLPTELGNRTAFAGAFAQGLGVAETGTRSAALAEIVALADAVLELHPLD